MLTIPKTNWIFWSTRQMVDGWEMGGEFMPSPSDHPLPLDERIVSKCGHRVEKTLFRSSQNGALIQYRVPIAGQGFALRVHYTKNPKRELQFSMQSIQRYWHSSTWIPAACNVLADGTSGVYTLNNHGRAINCSFTNMFPSFVSVLSLDVGAVPARSFGHASLRSNAVTHNVSLDISLLYRLPERWEFLVQSSVWWITECS